MSDLPYYCHVCSRVVYIEERIECPNCKQTFLEIYAPEDSGSSDDGRSNEVRRNRGWSFFSGIFGTFQRQDRRKPRQAKKSITSDRRNYAIGPEIDDIITRLREEKKIEEKPATENQKNNTRTEVPPEGETCMICLNAIEGQGVHYPCEHFFHPICSEAWLKLQSECPICRKSL